MVEIVAYQTSGEVHVCNLSFFCLYRCLLRRVLKGFLQLTKTDVATFYLLDNVEAYKLFKDSFQKYL